MPAGTGHPSGHIHGLSQEMEKLCVTFGKLCLCHQTAPMARAGFPYQKDLGSFIFLSQALEMALPKAGAFIKHMVSWSWPLQVRQQGEHMSVCIESQVKIWEFLVKDSSDLCLRHGMV